MSEYHRNETTRSQRVPFFSVIIPVHNKENHIERSILSVLQQEYSDFELIIVDDASTDRSVQKIVQFGDERIRVLRRDTPGAGGYAARNLGIAHALSEWILFLDADDEWLPGHLTHMFLFIRQNPSAAMVSCGQRIVTLSGQSVYDCYWRKNKHRDGHWISPSRFFRESTNGCRPVQTDTVCLFKPSLPDLSVFPEWLERGGDLFAWAKLVLCLQGLYWSRHVGSISYRNADNMVSRTSNYSASWIEAHLRELKPLANSEATGFFSDYINYLVLVYWKNAMTRDIKPERTAHLIDFSGNLFYALAVFLRVGIPFPLAHTITKFARRMLRSYRSIFH